jgi:protein TonB
MMRHRLASALLAATVLHGLCLSLVFAVALRASTVVGAVECTVDLAADESAGPEPEQTPARARPQDWTPSGPESAEVCPVEATFSDPPAVDRASHSVPRLIVDLAAPPSAVPAIEPVGCARPAPADILAATEYRRVAPAVDVSTNVVDSAVSHEEAAGTLVAVGTIRPVYPSSARMRGEEGLVTVAVETDDSGRPQNVVVTTPSGSSSLDRAAVDAARRARFASASGVPSRGRALLSFRFRLVD